MRTAPSRKSLKTPRCATSTWATREVPRYDIHFPTPPFPTPPLLELWYNIDKNVGMPKKTSERDSLLNPGIMEGYA